MLLCTYNISYTSLSTDMLYIIKPHPLAKFLSKVSFSSVSLSEKIKKILIFFPGRGPIEVRHNDSSH